MQKCALILAGGEGKRMKSLKPKTLCEVLEKPMLQWVIDALKAAEDNGDAEEEIKVQCVGAPRYRITVKSTDYLNAEKALKAAAERCIEVVEASDGNGSFLRELDD